MSHNIVKMLSSNLNPSHQVGINIVNALLLLQKERDLKCTQKAIDALLSNTLLRGRTRQYCLLLNNTDSISLKLRDTLSLKVDLLYLFKNNFITFDTVSPVSFESENKDIIRTKTVSDNQPTINVQQLQKQDSADTLKTVFTTSSNKDAENYSQDDTSTVSPLLQFASGSL